jgi:hypothetical protein
VEDRFGGSSTLSETTALSNRARQNPKRTRKFTAAHNERLRAALTLRFPTARTFSLDHDDTKSLHRVVAYKFAHCHQYATTTRKALD